MKGGSKVNMQGLVLAVLQAIIISSLLWVGNKTAESAEKVAALAVQVQGLEKQVKRIQDKEDREERRRQ